MDLYEDGYPYDPGVIINLGGKCVGYHCVIVSWLITLIISKDLCYGLWSVITHVIHYVKV